MCRNRVYFFYRFMPKKLHVFHVLHITTPTYERNKAKIRDHCRNPHAVTWNLSPVTSIQSLPECWNTIFWAVSTSLPHLTNVVSKQMKTKRKLVRCCVIQHWTRGKGKGVSTTCGSDCIQNKRIECLVRLRYSLTVEAHYFWLLISFMREMEYISVIIVLCCGWDGA